MLMKYNDRHLKAFIQKNYPYFFSPHIVHHLYSMMSLANRQLLNQKI